MNRTELINIVHDNAGVLADVTFILDGAQTTQTLVIEGRLNSKGMIVRHHADEPSFTIAPTKVIAITPHVVAEGDGMTTAEVAKIFDMTAKELRVITRSMGLGVGKGRRYAFVEADVDAIRAHLTLTN